MEYPKRYSEAEIEAMLWNELRKRGFDARLQIRDKSGTRRLRPDISVFRNHALICLVECKSWSPSYIRNRRWQKSRNRKQIGKYESYFQVPVLLCGCPAAIKPVADIVAKIHG